MQRQTPAPLAALHAAYYAIPAGTPTTEQVIEKLPALYEAIDGVLAETAKISGLLATIEDAEARGVTVHLATEATCEQYIDRYPPSKDS